MAETSAELSAYTSGAGDSLRGWKLFGITTADRPERAAHLVDELERTGLPAHLHVSTRPTDPGGFASTGVRGCFESHLACLRLARDEQVKVAVMVEDDAVVTRRIRSLLPAIEDELSDQDWTMVYLGYLGSQSPVSHRPLRPISPHIAAAEGWEVHGAHLLAFKGSALDIVIKNLEERLLPGGHRIPVDGAFNEFRRDMGEETLLCMPNLARQGPSPSGITETGGVKQRLLEAAVVRRVMFGLKRSWWDAVTFTPSPLTYALWNSRAKLRSTRATDNA
jgi:glycosyl transferase, family 25